MARKQTVNNQVNYQSWEEALNSFLAFKKAQGLRQSTLDSYRSFISIFFRRYPKAYKDKSILKASAIDFLSQDMSPSTYNLRYIYLKAFVNAYNSYSFMILSVYAKLHHATSPLKWLITILRRGILAILLKEKACHC